MLNKILIVLILFLQVGCNFNASITNSNDASSSTENSPTNPFTLKFNGKIKYTQSINPQLEILGLMDIQKYVLSPNKGSCQTSQNWIPYDSNSRFEITQKNQEIKFYLKTLNSQGQETDCFEQSVIHDDQIPNMISSLSFNLFPEMLGLNVSPEIIFNSLSDSLSGIDKIEAKIVNWETQADILSWTEIYNSGSNIQLPSPMAMGTFYQVWLKLTDKAGNERVIKKDQTFVDGVSVTMLTEPVLNACVYRGEPRFFDFDRDGDYDVILENSSIGFNTSCVFENIENTVFVLNDKLMDDEEFKKIKVIDINSDQIDDLIVQDVIGGHISIFYGELNGQFQKSTLLTDTNNILANVVDLDQDGVFEILYSNGTNNKFLKLNSSNNYVSQNINLPVSDWGQAKPVRLNNDPFQDFYVGINAGQLQFLLNSGDNLNYSLITLPVNISGETSAMPMDFNGDDLIDVIHVNTSGTHKISINLGNGSFSTTTITTSSVSGVYAVADFNQDGFDDFIADAQGKIFLNTAGSGFSSIPGFSKEPMDCNTTLINPCGLGVIDFDQDGDLDVLPIHFYYQNTMLSFLKLYENISNTHFKMKLTSKPMTDWNDDLIISDLNNDGKKEISYNSTDFSALFVYEKNSDQFLIQNILQTYNQNLLTILTDRNNDGFKDFVVGSSNSSTHLDFKQQTTSLNFTQSNITKSGTLTSMGTGQGTVGDSFEDFVITTFTPHNLVLYRNTNGTNYTPSTIHSSMSSYGIGSSMGDINNDTFPDLIVATQNGKIFQYLNNGSNVFPSSGTEISATGAGHAIQIKDFDNNGFQDILTVSIAGIYQKPITILYQTSLGTFSSEVIGYSTRGNSRGSKILGYCDYNLDGYEDIVTVDNSNLKVLLKDNTGRFTSSLTVARVQYDFASIDCANIDSDPNPEIVVNDNNKVYLIDR